MDHDNPTPALFLSFASEPSRCLTTLPRPLTYVMCLHLSSVPGLDSFQGRLGSDPDTNSTTASYALSVSAIVDEFILDDKARCVYLIISATSMSCSYIVTIRIHQSRSASNQTCPGGVPGSRRQFQAL